MKLAPSLLLSLFAFLASAAALDLSAVPDNNPGALKQAIVAEGGAVEGEPYLSTEAGPDGKPAKLIVLPTPFCLVSLPAMPAVKCWAMSASIRIDELPYAKAGGGMFGMLFGPNDSVLAITGDKWSKLRAPALFCGSAVLLNEEQFKASGAMEAGEWRKVMLSISGTEWHLKIGELLNETGSVENDTRGALGRKGKLFMRIGNFAGASTIPELTEAP
jgi:hypothetical protein